MDAILRILAGLFGAFLVLGSAWWFFHRLVLVPPGVSYHGILDFAGFLGIGAIVYVGVTLGVGIRWWYAKKKGHVLTSKQIFLAGLGGVFCFSVAREVAMGFYGLYKQGSFMEGGVFAGQGFAFFLSILAVVWGAVAAAGITLILYCVSN